MCLTPKVYLFLQRLSKTSPLTGPGSFAAGSNVSTTVTSPVTTLVQMTPRRRSIAPALNAITAAPLMEVDEKGESQVDAQSEETSSTKTVDDKVDVDQESTCPTMSLLETMSTAQELVDLTQSLKPTIGTVQSSTCLTKSPQPEVGTAQSPPRPAKSLLDLSSVDTPHTSTRPANSLQSTGGLPDTPTCPAKSLLSTLDTPDTPTCPAESLLSTLDTPDTPTCPAKSLLSTPDTPDTPTCPAKSLLSTLDTPDTSTCSSKSLLSTLDTPDTSTCSSKSLQATGGPPDTSTCAAKSPLSTVDTPDTSTCSAKFIQPISGVVQNPASSTTEADENKAGQFGLSHKAIGPNVAKPTMTVHDVGDTTAHPTEMDKENESHADAKSKGILTASMLEAVVNVDQPRFTAERDKEETVQCGKSQTTVRGSTASQVANVQAKLERTMYRERMAFVTVTCIFVGSVVCLLPNHVTFTIMTIDSSLIPKWWRDLTNWLMFCNSTINPFLYNFGSLEFRRAFREIFSCRRASRHEWQ